MPFILNIDTATETAMICISQNETVLDVEINSKQRDHASFLQPAIKNLLEKNDISFDKLHAVAVTAGPGSYTGLRVGMASAKGLCYALKIPFITLNTLEVMALSSIMLNKKNSASFFCPMIDARRQEVFTAIYDETLKEILSPRAMILQEDSFEEFLKNQPVIFSGSGAIKSELILKNPNAIFSDVKISPEAMTRISADHFKRSEFADIHLSQPLYLKEFHTQGN